MWKAYEWRTTGWKIVSLREVVKALLPEIFKCQIRGNTRGLVLNFQGDWSERLGREEEKAGGVAGSRNFGSTAQHLF